MKAAVVNGPGQKPRYTDFSKPIPKTGEQLILVRASALSPLTKSRASGSPYSSDGQFPAVAGTDGVGRTNEGQRVYFVLPEAPFGALAEKSLVKAQYCIPLPDDLDDTVAAAIANPGMSAWAAMMERAHLKAGETVLINGATGTAGRMAVQLAKYFGAAKIIATGRDEGALEEVKALGADVTIPLTLGSLPPLRTKRYEEALIQEFAKGVDVVVDYLWGEAQERSSLPLQKVWRAPPPFDSCTSAAQAEKKASTCRVRVYALPQLCSWGAASRACARQNFLKQSRASSMRPSQPNCR